MGGVADADVHAAPGARCVPLDGRYSQQPEGRRVTAATQLAAVPIPILLCRLPACRFLAMLATAGAAPGRAIDAFHVMRCSLAAHRGSFR